MPSLSESNILELCDNRKHSKKVIIEIWEKEEKRKNGREWILKKKINNSLGISLVGQWLRLHTPNAETLGSIPDLETRSHMLQLTVHMP